MWPPFPTAGSKKLKRHNSTWVLRMVPVKLWPSGKCIKVYLPGAVTEWTWNRSTLTPIHMCLFEVKQPWDSWSKEARWGYQPRSQGKHETGEILVGRSDHLLHLPKDTQRMYKHNLYHLVNNHRYWKSPLFLSFSIGKSWMASYLHVTMFVYQMVQQQIFRHQGFREPLCLGASLVCTCNGAARGTKRFNSSTGKRYLARIKSRNSHG